MTNNLILFSRSNTGHRMLFLVIKTNKYLQKKQWISTCGSASKRAFYVCATDDLKDHFVPVGADTCTHLHARGKPSTWFPRGWPVETECVVWMWDIGIACCCEVPHFMRLACYNPLFDRPTRHSLTPTKSYNHLHLHFIVCTQVMLRIRWQIALQANCNSRIAETSKNIERANKTREWSTFPKFDLGRFRVTDFSWTFSVSESEIHTFILNLTGCEPVCQLWPRRREISAFL